ncbi:MAG: hypothetical protein GY801_50280 [bacterium]|nr:hypothetical protein [bacterium]
MSNMSHFFVVYVLIWAGLAWYMSTLAKKQKLLREEIYILKNRLRVRE